MEVIALLVLVGTYFGYRKYNSGGFMTPKTPKSICPCEITTGLVRPETPKTMVVIWL